MPQKGGESVDCLVCGKEIPTDDPCYQVRYGYLTEGDDFEATEDLGYTHEGCLPLTPTM
jgi:hypothetical protein